MKKLVIILSILLLSTLCFGQTKELEMQNLAEMFQNGEFDEEGYKYRADEWYKLMDEFGGYPEFPINEGTGTIEFTYVKEFPLLDKKDIFNRVLEWGALNYGNVSNIINYQNIEDGKIILKGFFYIYHHADYNGLFVEKKLIVRKKCSYVFILTIVDRKIKINITNLWFTYIPSSGQATGGHDYEFSIHELYPITKGKTKFWNENLSMLIETKKKLEFETNYLTGYIFSKMSDYDF